MNTETEPLVFDATDADFESSVIDRSNQVPVVVDFWAEWCGPCKALGPVLESLAVEFEGKFVLAKVDTDANPRLAAAFAVRSIPMVVAIRHAKQIDSFVGALPEANLREFLARLLPSKAETRATEALTLIQNGDPIAAEKLLREALDLDPRCDAALLSLAEILNDKQETDAAVDLLDRIGPGTPQRAEADRLTAAIRIRSAGDADEGPLATRLASDPDDHEARLQIARSMAARKAYADALEHCLELVQRDRTFEDDAGRTTMLEIFDLLGNDHHLTQHYRSELAKALFR